jgi:hypothetical protein
MPSGALILGSKNVTITDGDRIGVRKGSEIFGSTSTATTPITGLHTKERRDGTNIMMRAYDESLEYYHTGTEAWENLNDGYTAAQTFGFADHNVNTDALDYTYFCNAIDPYSRWTGRFTQLDGALSGGEGTITVDSVLTDTVFNSGTSTTTTTTTLVVSGGWATDLWNDFYIHITSGASVGKISKITATTSTQVTFGAIAGLTGNPTYEIRQIAYNDSSNMTIRIGTTDVAYTGFGTTTTFTGCTNTPAASDDAAVAQAVEEFPENPRGNVLLVHNTRMFVTGSKGNRIQKGAESTVFYSAIADATDFTFSSPRTADEGGTIDTPEGGGGVIGLGTQEDTIYILKRNLVKTLTFTQDTNDLPTILPLINSPQVGPESAQGVFKMDNFLMYASSEGAIKSVGRLKEIDYVQRFQISDPIRSLVGTFSFTNAAGIFYKQKAYISAQQSGGTFNDVVLVYDAEKEAWDAPSVGWLASHWTIYNGELYYGSSTGPEVYKVEVDSRYDDNDAPYECVARFAYSNYGAPAVQKEFQKFFLEGYIAENTTISIVLRYNYLGRQETKTMELAGTDEAYMLSDFDYSALGTGLLGVDPLGAVLGDEDATSDLQKFRVYFPIGVTPFYEMSVEVSSNEAGAIWEILRYGTDVYTRSEINTKLLKSF